MCCLPSVVVVVVVGGGGGAGTNDWSPRLGPSRYVNDKEFSNFKEDKLANNLVNFSPNMKKKITIVLLKLHIPSEASS